MNPRRCHPFLALLCAGSFLLAAPAVEAGNPIGDFFKRLGNSIAHPQRKKPARQPPRPGTARAPVAHPTVAEANALQRPPGGSPSPTPAIVRPAVRAPQNNVRRDLPYGVPVRRKPGFVTSPYAPTRGVVDVRGFPPGTEVKDPYTDKMFLTP